MKFYRISVIILILQIECKIQEIQLYDPSLTIRGALGVYLLRILESQSLVSMFFLIHSKSLIIIIKAMLSKMKI